MPHVQPSWRHWPQWKWASRILCFFGIHHWYRSKTLQDKPIACSVCSKKTRHYKAYVALAKQRGVG